MMSKPLNLTSKKTKSPPEIIPKGYKPFLEDLKSKIRSSQIKAAVRVNSTLIELYWQIGKDIADMQEKEKWGHRSLNAWRKIFKMTFRECKDFQGETYSICANLRNPTQTLQLCSKLLH